MLPEEDLFDVEETLEPEPDEVDEVLASLRALMEKTSSPVMRACLEDTHDDIAHLAGKDAPSTRAEDQAEAV